jgi:hypothetical protein
LRDIEQRLIMRRALQRRERRFKMRCDQVF